jgi:hypothetical protein
MLQIYIYMHRLQNRIAMQNKRFSLTIIVIWKFGTKYSEIIKINIDFYLLMETKLLSKIVCVILLLFHPPIIKYFMLLSSELVDQCLLFRGFMRLVIQVVFGAYVQHL